MSDWGERRPYLALAIGVLAVSSAAIWVRASALPPVVLAFYRLAFAAAGLWAVWVAGAVRGRRSRFDGPPRWRRWAIVAGMSLAAHWSVWFASLRLTSVLSSTVLVTTQPVWVVLLAWALWRERVRVAQAGGLAVALAGSAVIAAADAWHAGRSGDPAAALAEAFSTGGLAGDFLALLAAVLVSVYLLTGQRLRPRVPLLPYLLVVYTTGALALVPVCLATGQSLAGWPWREMAVALGLAVIPTLVGHSALNLVVGRVGASVVATAVLGEPVGASALALVLFGEWPSALHVAGAGLILAGIYLFAAPVRAAVPQEVGGDHAVRS